MAPALIKLMNALEPVVNWLKELSPTSKMVIIVIGGLLAILGPLLMMIGFLTTGIGTMITAFATIGPVIIGVLPLLLAISAAVVGVTLAFRAWKKEGPEAIEGVLRMFEDLYNWIEKIKDSAKRMLPEWMQKAFFGINVVNENTPGVTKGQLYAYEHGSISTKKALERQFSKSQADINIKVTSDGGSTATVESVKKKGDANVNLATVGYIGAF